MAVQFTAAEIEKFRVEFEENRQKRYEEQQKIAEMIKLEAFNLEAYVNQHQQKQPEEEEKQTVDPLYVFI